MIRLIFVCWLCVMWDSIDAQQAPAVISRYVIAEMKAEHMPGLALGVYRNGHPVCVQGIGKGNIDSGAPVKPATGVNSDSLAKQFVAVKLLLLFSLLQSAIPVNAQKSPDNELISEKLSQRDIALLHELFHLQGAIGHLVWEKWSPISTAPILYKTKNFDYLFNHPNPPKGFVKVDDVFWKGAIYVRPNTDSNAYRATFPVNGIETVVISAPETDDNPCLWELQACHELFHIFQNQNTIKVMSPFQGKYKDSNELSFPFNYKDDAILASCRVEAEYSFDLLKQMKLDSVNRMVAVKVYRDILKIDYRTFSDSGQVKYKQWMEWKEGVARYTEREVAMFAMDENKYRPAEDFTQYFKEKYSDDQVKSFYNNMLNPIRFVGEGVRGTVMFYYLGMGKAYLLDAINKNWKSSYFNKNLDELITNVD